MGNKHKQFCAFIHGRIITPEREMVDGALLFQGPKIHSLGKDGDVAIPADAEVLDCTGKVLIPGLIDIHLHGGGGKDFSDEQALIDAACFHGSQGTTSLLPTLTTESPSVLKQQLRTLCRVEASSDERIIPEILGFYLEGPFLNPQCRGTFDAGLLSLPQSGMVKELVEASDRRIRMMTLAPELDGSEAVLEEMLAMGIIPAMGHTAASYEEAEAAYSRGIRHMTHLFNAMSGFHHREPGCAMAALVHPDVTVEVIVDGHHLHQGTVILIHRLKGAEKMILISDAAPLAGQEEGMCRLGGKEVTIREGKALNREGKLAGSLLTMGGALRKAVQWAGIPLFEAVRMATLNPAQLLGLSDRKGRLVPGADADLVILNPSMEVESVYIRGAKL